MKLRLIPAGTFTMGSSKEEIDHSLKFGAAWDRDTGSYLSEGPEHQVEITRPFYLATTEVTVGQFRQFVEDKGYRRAGDRWRDPGFDQTDNHPVVFVSWNAAIDFCKWLSEKEGKTYRLPTESEWEYCCRAGKSGFRYCYGDDDAQLEDYAWYHKNSGGGTHPVGQKKPNDWGLHDMHGNAWEWCQDYYAQNYYKRSPVKDPKGPDVGGMRVHRGGTYKSHGLSCRSASRPSYPADGEYDGFRVLLVLPSGGFRPEGEAKVKPSN
jgi:formylglycine-generating enzyme required for sulfatase activity